MEIVSENIVFVLHNEIKIANFADKGIVLFDICV